VRVDEPHRDGRENGEEVEVDGCGFCPFRGVSSRAQYQVKSPHKDEERGPNGQTFAVIFVQRSEAASGDAAPVSALRHVPAELQCQHRLARPENAQEASWNG
jgi:hypothetical protein